MKEIIIGQLLAIIDAIDHEVETIKEARKDIRSKLNKIDKAIKINEELDTPIVSLVGARDGHLDQLEDTAHEIRDFKLVRYRMMTAISILQGDPLSPVEEVPTPTECEE